jgi:uncharacterized protein
VKLHASAPSGLNTFTGYGDGYVTVNGERHEENLIVLPERILAWGAQSFETLCEEDFAPLAALGLEVVLIGTGARQRFPHPRLIRCLAQARVGVESMDVQAACRTYNILAAEARKVAAALLLR